MQEFGFCCWVNSFLLARRSKEALWSYERHLKQKGDGPVELILFSEQEDLNVKVLVDKLHGSSSSAQVSVLLMLTWSSSYLWLDREHHPKKCGTLHHAEAISQETQLCDLSHFESHSR